MVMASFVGLATGLAAVAFDQLITGVDAVLFDWLFADVLRTGATWPIYVAPAIGGLLCGVFTYRLARDVRGAGVSPVLVSVETRGGKMNPWTAVTKPIASALTIGSGGSAGTEGPVVQIGAALGSSFAQVLRLSEENTKLLLAAGAAGGIAATFNAPIAGVFFALEVILRRFNTRNFSVVVLASIVATATAVSLRGDGPALPVPLAESTRLVSAIEIPLYALLGLLAGVVGVLFIRALYWTEDRFDRSPVPPLLLPAAGGLLVGLIALANRDTLGIGGDALDQMLGGDGGGGTLAILLVLKLAATAVTIGSGGSGGVFGPSLFIGAALGAHSAAASMSSYPTRPRHRGSTRRSGWLPWSPERRARRSRPC